MVSVRASTEADAGGAIVVVMTRWSKLDLTGQIINQMTKNDDVDDWEVVEFPAILEDKKGNEVPLWPEFWPLEELKARRAALDIRYWNAQYLQNPTSEEGALIKREWWNMWEEEDPPPCEFIIMTLDAAQEANNRADYNALTTWGVFLNEETNNYAIILLNAIKERLEFPELKQLCLEEYQEWEPDAFIVEKNLMGQLYIKSLEEWEYLLENLRLERDRIRLAVLMLCLISLVAGLFMHPISVGRTRSLKNVTISLVVPTMTWLTPQL